MVLAFFAMMGDSLRRLSKINNALQRASAAAGRIFETLAVPVERRRRPWGLRSDRNGRGAADLLPIKLQPIQRSVRFEDVTYAYPNATAPALRDVNLSVMRGQ
jgi:ABC-type multidrug transport system fused ATPase/permease subunit